MKVKRLSNAAIISPGMMLGEGGEGSVYEIQQDSSCVAKIYHYEKLQELETRGDKLRVMLENAPSDPTLPDHCSIAWPVDLLLSTDGSDTVIGFLMPRLRDMAAISDYYNPQSRKSEHPHFRYDQLCRTATNLASAVSALHDRGYIIGDVKESNVLVSDAAMVTLIDTDSFQVRDPKCEQFYRCLVGTDLYLPRELQGKKLSEVDRFPHHDMFGIATLFFQLLMENTQPFARIITPNEESLVYPKLIDRGDFPYVENSGFVPPPHAPPFEMLHPQLRELFVQCFANGNADPTLRPGAGVWHKALKEAEKSLRPCSINVQHSYFSHYPQCPWCERAKLLQRDPFPPRQRSTTSAQTNYGARSSAAAQPAPIPAATASAASRPVAPPRPVAPARAAAQPVQRFYADRAQIIIGQSTVLRWDIPNAQSITISDNAGRVIYYGISSQDKIVVYPGKDTVYGIRVSGVTITTASSVHVSVSLPPLPISLCEITGLNEPHSLGKASVPLRSFVPLKDQLARLYKTAILNTPLRLSPLKNLVKLRDYLPLLQPIYFSTPSGQTISDGMLAGFANTARSFWRFIKM